MRTVGLREQLSCLGQVEGEFIFCSFQFCPVILVKLCMEGDGTEQQSPPPALSCIGMLHRVLLLPGPALSTLGKPHSRGAHERLSSCSTLVPAPPLQHGGFQVTPQSSSILRQGGSKPFC